jgi:PAS domain S-box-containing protein
MNPQGEIIFINNYGLKFFGYRQQELLGKKVTATIVPKKERSSKRNLAKMISELLAKPEKFSNNENENVNKKGERFYISWTNKAILGQDGKLLKIICVGNDLSERKEMEERLKTKLKVQKVLGQISSAILKNTNFTEAISECLPIINQEFGFNFCCFLPIKEAQLTEPISYPPAALKLTKGKDETANAAIIKKLKKALLVKLSAKEKALFKIRPKINSSKPLLAISLTAKKELIGCFLISYQENYNIASLELFWQLLAELISTTYLKEQAENRIFNLYRHIGILNRQISVLFEFISLQRPTAKDQMKMLIAEYAQLISNAHYTLLYEYQDSNQVFTLQATTLKSKLPTEIKELPLKNYPFLQELIEYKIRVQRTKDNLKVKNPFKHANYFIALPIIYKQNLQSALIICFKSSKAVSSTEINFYSVFAGQASLMLAGNLLKSEEN